MQQANIKSLRRDFINPYTRFLPLRGTQLDVYRMAEATPPGLVGYQPRWEVMNAALGAQQSIELKVDLMSDFHLLAILCSATASTVGGFRAQFYDAIKQLRLQDRGIQFANLGGNSAAAFFLREPYRFNLPKSQLLAILQNLEPTANTVQLVFFGFSAPFTGELSNEF